MKKIGIFMADGCEEIEGLTVVDVVRRAGIAIDMISITGKKEVAGATELRLQQMYWQRKLILTAMMELYCRAECLEP
nr:MULTISPECIES: hypothetical protein [unclassified Roseburia]